MDRFKNMIVNHISGRRVLGLFILTNVVYAFMLMITIPRTMEFSKGMKLLDMMPMGYDFNYVMELFNALGEGGRAVYLFNQIPIDMVYPLLFGLTYSLLLAYFLKKAKRFNTVFSHLCLLPIIAAIADYFENFGIIKMLNNYPNFTKTTVNVTNVFSIIKSTSTSIYFIVLITTLLLLGIKLLKKTPIAN